MDHPRRDVVRSVAIIAASVVLGAAVAAGQNIVLDPDGSPAATIPGDTSISGNVDVNGNQIFLDGSGNNDRLFKDGSGRVVLEDDDTGYLRFEASQVSVRNTDLDVQNNNVRNRGNYWWGRVGLDSNGVVYTTSDGNSGTFSWPGSGNTSCASGNVTCVHNDGSGNFMAQFEIPSKYTQNWGGGDPSSGIGGMCWTATSGDNEMRTSEYGQGATHVSGDRNGHCLGGISNCAGFEAYDQGSADMWAIVCWLPNGG